MPANATRTDQPAQTRRPARIRATLIGFTAVLMWGALALFTDLSGTVPPFQMVAMTFAIAFLLMAAKWTWTGERWTRHLRHPPAVWLLGVGGLFGYHACYFVALRLAPAAEASLIAYLWPLLIVVLSGLLPGERLRAAHILGALMGLAGTATLIARSGLAFDPAAVPGYLAAAACALIWSTYSVGSRRFGDVPTDAVGWFCAATAVLGLACHLAFETTVWPAGAVEWAAVAALGLGPVGLAFFAWDIGMKRGDVRLLGVASYAAPVISTLLLVGFGRAEPSWRLAVACALVAGGALTATFGARITLRRARA